MKALGYLTVLVAILAMTACKRSRNNEGDVVDKTYVHRYGVEVPSEKWASSGKHGQVISTLKTGVVVSESYNAGILEGDATYTFPHSDAIEVVKTYSKGILVREVLYFPSGYTFKEVVYSPNLKSVTTYYEAGNTQSIEDYQDDVLVNGTYYSPTHKTESLVTNGSGVQTNRDAYGQLISSDAIQKGLMVSRTLYHPNGSIKEVNPYVDGKIQGLRKTYLPAGEPDTVEEWVSGVQEGTTIVFRNGEKFSEFTYVNGVKDGVEKRYRDGVTLVEEIPWVKGKKQGVAHIYIANSTKTNWYFQDVKVTREKYDNLINPPHIQ